MDTASASNCSSGSVCVYSRRRNPSPSLFASGFTEPHHDQYEICGLKNSPGME
ncbi:MAG: hypothetical protein K9M81_06005 [Chthoniobacterales bacterium]|nr:hypothetical protein [Chthoniobacterales bacterium]